MVVQEEEMAKEEIEDEGIMSEAIPLAKISLNSVVGLTNPKTLQARGCVGEQSVVVLIDPGATHNFISIKPKNTSAIPLAEISLNSVVGLTNPKTLQARGCVGEQSVVVLIDPGATHNFISIKLTEKMKIPAMTTVGYGV